MSSKREIEIHAEKIALYEKLIKTNPAVERKGATMPYTSLNGNMFSFMGKDGILGLRLSKDDREEFIKKYKTVLVEQYGVVMKEYVKVPEKLLSNTKELKKHFDRSYEYAGSLNAKPTTQKQVKNKKKENRVEYFKPKEQMKNNCCAL